MPSSHFTIQIEAIKAKVHRKRIKNLYIKIKKNGGVEITAPTSIKEEVIHNFFSTKINWIKKHQKKILSSYQPPLQYVDGEIHYWLGRPYRLEINPGNKKYKESPIQIIERDETTENKIILTTKANSTTTKRQALIEQWYRERLHEFIANTAPEWEKRLGVQATWLVKKMKTRWGSCNPRAKRIWINLELIKRSPQAIEYVMVHELIHFFERGHNRRFYQLMSQYFPNWKQEKEKLLQLLSL